MPKLSKRRAANAGIAPAEPLKPQDAIPALRRFKAAKFDETVNVVVNLGIDPKQADQALRGSIAMPHGIGKSVRVACFCNPDKVEAALRRAPSPPARTTSSRRSTGAGSTSTSPWRAPT